MRFLFKTSYSQDVDLIQHGGQRFWYGLLGLALLAAVSVAALTVREGNLERGDG